MSKLSSKLNRYFHAMLSDILRSCKEIKISNDDYFLSINTSISNLEQLKMFFKIADPDYPKKQSGTEPKKVFCDKLSNELFGSFGIPISIKEINSSELIHHIEWIKKICALNKIHIDQNDWEYLINEAKRR